MAVNGGHSAELQNLLQQLTAVQEQSALLQPPPQLHALPQVPAPLQLPELPAHLQLQPPAPAPQVHIPQVQATQPEPVLSGPAPEQKPARPTPVHRGSGTRFSGTPLYRFSLRRDEQRRLQEEENQRQGVPEGYVRQTDDFYYNPVEKRFWHSGSQKFYLYNEATKAYTEIHRATSIENELRMCIDASCINRQEGVKENRHVIIRDLVKAGASLKMPIEHLPRPCTLIALFNGHRPQSLAADEAPNDAPAACAEFCARNFHLKLLRRLADFQGDWNDDQIVEALRSSCEDLDKEFLSRSSSSALDGCSAVFALFTGQRQFVAGLGDAAGYLGEEGREGRHQVVRQTMAHSPAGPSEFQRVRAAGGSVVHDERGGSRTLHIRSRSVDGAAEVLLHVSRAFGDRTFKVGGSNGSSVVLAVPDVQISVLDRRKRFLVLVCSEIASVLSNEDIGEVLHRRNARPRMACGALLAAAKARGARGSLTALCVFFEWTLNGAPQDSVKRLKDGADDLTPPPSKKPKLDSALHSAPKQVRCRQILVRHKDCREPTDRVRSSKPVTRTLAEAECILREALEAIESSPEKSIFTQRCKAVSECSTCLKGGEMAGDLGWISRGQAHPVVEAAAFALPIGHISDIVESDEGVHVLWRIA